MQNKAIKLLATTNLSLRNWVDPRHSQVNANGHNTNNPEGLPIILTLVSEDNSKDDTTKVSASTGDTRDDTVGEGVDVRYEREVGSISGFEEECHTSDEAEHGRVGV